MELISHCRFFNQHNSPVYNSKSNLNEAFYATLVDLDQEDDSCVIIPKLVRNLANLMEIEIASGEGFVWDSSSAIRKAFERNNNELDAERADKFAIAIVRVEMNRKEIVSIEVMRILTIDISSVYTPEPRIIGIGFATNN